MPFDLACWFARWFAMDVRQWQYVIERDGVFTTGDGADLDWCYPGWKVVAAFDSEGRHYDE